MPLEQRQISKLVLLLLPRLVPALTRLAGRKIGCSKPHDANANVRTGSDRGMALHAEPKGAVW